MKARIELKFITRDFDIHKVEMIPFKRGCLLYRKTLTSEERRANAFNKVREFKGKWYTKQEIVITYREVFRIIRFVVFHPFRYRKYVKQNER